jgi:hypothetical protein
VPSKPVKSFFYSTLAIKKAVFRSSERRMSKMMLDDVEASDDIGEV